MDATPSATPPATDTAADHRERLLQAMARAVGRRGYAETTIADIVGEAGVSKRTFYEHFASKGECLLALYRAASRRALAMLDPPVDPDRDLRSQVAERLREYFACLASNPVLLRTLFIEILGLGETGLRARRQANDELSAVVLRQLNACRLSDSPRLDAQQATALVGAINELVLQRIEQGRTEQLAELAEPACAIVFALGIRGAV
jgi:AcrR family transcriptional regulator